MAERPDPLLLFGLLVAAGVYFMSKTQKGQSVVNAAIDYGTQMLTGLYPGEAPYAEVIEAAESNHGIPRRLLAALLYQESRYRQDIIDGSTRSRVGAMGIAQFMPATAVEWLGSEAAALNPAVAIPGAARYLAWLSNRHGSWRLAVAAYNYGTGNVSKKTEDQWPEETRKYVASVYDSIYPSA